ncbi:hypothetical protein FB567DRAFT_307045 [Paraphoma chrysanthemicola]|uniref:SWIRM domain-containing protein n=1 Tax=Paraphoma chrysanthemicola TaxID=798071 RepID=A0A8K0W0I5_9PLEO|nr:hypothetical protein FB567DRAFT_307045 [Paraphoma chrysanthemicola]
MANLPFTTPPSHRLTVSSLLSPPETKRSESFGSSMEQLPQFRSPFSSFDSQASHSVTGPDFNPTIMAYTAMLPAKRAAYASPPISPAEAQKENMEFVADQGARDPQLFVSGSAAVPIAPDEPLFPQESQEATQDAITQHMNSAEYAHLKSKPERKDYELAVSFYSTVFEKAFANPKAWRAQERAYEQYYGKPTGVQKRTALKKLAPAPSSRPRQPKMALARLPPRAPRTPKPKRTPVTQVYHSFDESAASASPKPARPATNRDDTDYNALPDYCPPLDTLPKGNPKSLKAEWKGTVLDLSTDPDRHMLHEAEVPLAATLRLNCATYLCSKRRIFAARIDALRIGKEFRKTDAQQACKIDVNKASKLWQSFDKVGWFNPDYFRQYL